jgi:hypothetical protein
LKTAIYTKQSVNPTLISHIAPRPTTQSTSIYVVRLSNHILYFMFCVPCNMDRVMNKYQ